jgi:hypothetical protein
VTETTSYDSEFKGRDAEPDGCTGHFPLCMYILSCIVECKSEFDDKDLFNHFYCMNRTTRSAWPKIKEIIECKKKLKLLICTENFAQGSALPLWKDFSTIECRERMANVQIDS